MFLQIKNKLTDQISDQIVDEIFEHYIELKTAYRVQDWEKCLLRGGKFSEAIMKAIYYIRTNTCIRQISVASEIDEVGRRGDLSESIRLMIPRAVKVLYDHRSRRGGAHSSFDPNSMDCAMVVSIADWIVGELIRVYCTSDPESAMKFVAGITARTIPIVEKIGEDYIVLKKEISARLEIGWLLYSRYPEYTTNEQLQKWIINHTEDNISTTLRNMRKSKLVHLDSDGYILTTSGLAEIEREINRLEIMPSLTS